MANTPKPLVVTSDLVKDLQRLALVHFEDDEAYKTAKLRYEQANLKAVSSTSKFSVELYKFVLLYAAAPDLIKAKLDELGIKTMEDSDYFLHVSRLVFAKLPEGGAKRQRESFYAGLVRKAHQRGMSAKDFEALVADGVTLAVKRLSPQSKISTGAKELDKARDIASNFMNNEEYVLTGAKLAEEVKEGSELQLLARYVNGKITVYGVVPPQFSNTEAVLTKLVASTTTADKHKYDVIRDMLNTIKLVTKPHDENAIASYKVKDSKFHFVVSGTNVSAVLTATSEFDFLKRDITLTVAQWGRLLSTLLPMTKHITMINASSKEIVVSVDELAIPDINTWTTENGHVRTTGKASGSTLLFEPKMLKEQLEEPTGRWDPLAILPMDKVVESFKFTPSKKYTSLTFGKDNTVKLAALARIADGDIHLTKRSYRQFKSACSKMKAWTRELHFEQRKKQLRASAHIHDGITVSAIVQVD